MIGRLTSHPLHLDKASMAHDETIEYETENPYDPEWTNLVYDAMSAGTVQAFMSSGQVLVDGPCPRCGGNVRFTHDLDVYAGDGDGVGGLIAARTSAKVYVPIDVTCECSGSHPNRPEGEDSGCGISFTISVEISR